MLHDPLFYQVAKQTSLLGGDPSRQDQIFQDSDVPLVKVEFLEINYYRAIYL